MKKRIQKIKSASKRSKFAGLAVFAIAFAVLGGLFVLSSMAAPGLCSTTDVIGTATSTVSVPETAQYRVWVRMQVPDTSNTNNLNGIRLELAGSNNQCFTVTTTSSSAVNQWMWVNSDATAASTAHITSSMNSGNYTAKILGLKAGVKVDKVIMLRSDNTCTPDNAINGSRQPGDNCTTPPPTVDISANNTSVTNGSSVILTWAVTNAQTCTASANNGATGWTGAKSAAGSNETLTNRTVSATYTITCDGIGGQGVSDSVTVNVTPAPAPVVTLTASPMQVVTDNPSTLTWTVTNTATSCTAGGDWTGSRDVAGGSQSTGNLTANRRYTLQCTGPGGPSNTASVDVTVTATPPPTDTEDPTVAVGVQGVTVNNGEAALVRNQKEVVWQPLWSDNVSVTSVTLTVNGTPVTLTNGQYRFGGRDTGRNGNYVLKIVAADARGNSTESEVTIRLRHPDIDRSGTINGADVSSVLNRWMTVSIPHDIDGNGTIGGADVSYVLNRYGSTQ